MSRKGVLYIVSGPSGAGKSTLCEKVVELFGDLSFSISYTTRTPRDGEVDGKDYHFVDGAAFDSMVEQGEFLEHALVHGNKYGTALKSIEDTLNSGTDVILDIDVQGAQQIKEEFDAGATPGKAVFVFVAPPSMAICEERLIRRANLKEEELKGRLSAARGEVRRAGGYGYIIVNNDLNDSIEALKSVIISRRHTRDAVWDSVKSEFDI